MRATKEPSSAADVHSPLRRVPGGQADTIDAQSFITPPKWGVRQTVKFARVLLKEGNILVSDYVDATGGGDSDFGRAIVRLYRAFWWSVRIHFQYALGLT
jgi:hypothetical protein